MLYELNVIIYVYVTPVHYVIGTYVRMYLGISYNSMYVRTYIPLYMTLSIFLAEEIVKQ